MRLANLYALIPYIIFIGLFSLLNTLLPFGEYKNNVISLLLWMLFLLHLYLLLFKKISIDHLFRLSLIMFSLGAILGSIGLVDIAELLLKLSFLHFLIGIVETTIGLIRVK